MQLFNYIHIKFSFHNYLTENVDYKSGPYNVDFRKGEIRSYLSIPMIDDDSYEGVEYFTIYIGSLPHGLVRANPHIVKVKVTDDECKYS